MRFRPASASDLVVSSMAASVPNHGRHHVEPIAAVALDHPLDLFKLPVDQCPPPGEVLVELVPVVDGNELEHILEKELKGAIEERFKLTGAEV